MATLGQIFIFYFVHFFHPQTPLHIAALKGHYEAAKILLENGALPSAVNPRRWNQTPLHVAALKG